MILPSNNISILDVRNILGSPSVDLGTLCTCSNINHFSKWKPVSYYGNTLTDAILANINYGITVSEATNIDSLISKIDTNGTYTYNKPVGGAGSPYRLGDFRNYNSSATLPVTPMGNRQIDNGGSAVTKLLTFISTGDDYTIGINDIYDYGDIDSGTINLNRGIYMINSNGNTAWCTNEVDWSEIPTKANWTTGDITCYDFLTNVTKGINETYVASSTDRFYAIVSDSIHPNPYTWTLTGNAPAGSALYFFTVNGTQTEDYKYVNYSLTMSSIGDVYSGGTAKNITVSLYVGTTAIQTFTISKSYTIGSEESKSWSGVLFVPTTYQSSSYNILLYVYANSTLLIKTSVIKPSLE